MFKRVFKRCVRIASGVQGLRGGGDDAESSDPMVFGKPRRPVPKAKSEAKAARSPSLGTSKCNSFKTLS